jgi:hypothetical protein
MKFKIYFKTSEGEFDSFIVEGRNYLDIKIKARRTLRSKGLSMRNYSHSVKM